MGRISPLLARLQLSREDLSWEHFGLSEMRDKTKKAKVNLLILLIID